MNTFQGMTDLGDTPYLAALDLATTVISKDPDLYSSKNPQYFVVFMSDGQPYGPADVAGTSDQILAQLQTMVSLNPGRISFSTVYYGVSDPIASGLLQQMAKTGNGNFLDTNVDPSGLDFAISDLVNIPCN